MALRRSQFLACGVALAVVGCSSGHPTTTPSPQEADAAARAAIAAERSIDPTRIPDRAVGVPPMAITASDTTLSALGYGLSDLLANDLARSSRLTVVERLQLDAVLRELSLAKSGAVDTATAPRLGESSVRGDWCSAECDNFPAATYRSRRRWSTSSRIE